MKIKIILLALFTIDPTVKYQTIKGWEGTAQAGQDVSTSMFFSTYQNQPLDSLANELGINRL